MVQLRALLSRCDAAKHCDPKLRLLHIVYEEFVRYGHGKLLIFTEFRATQRWLMRELERMGAKVACIYGKQSEEQKRDAIDVFEQDADVLVSTDAGAEGFNIQTKCHVVVNFDLPWNPTNLEQRIGRAYRVGQAQRTIVINAMIESDYNDYVLARSHRRAETIAAELQTFGAEFEDGYADRLFGAPSHVSKIKSLLRLASGHTELRDEARIGAALLRTRTR